MVVALVLQSRTLLPDVAFWDTAEFQAIGAVLGIAHPTGYPTYTLLAWLASVLLQPFGSEAVRANLLSALLVAGSCAVVAVAIERLTGRRLMALGAGICLAVVPTVWRIGVRADAHALHLFLVALLAVLLLVWADRSRSAPDSGGRWLVAAAVVAGLALGNHALTLLLAPGVAAFVLLVDPWLPVRRWRTAVGCVIALVVTTVGVYAYLPIRSAMDPPLDYADPETLTALRYVVFGEQFRGTFSPLPSLADGVALVGRILTTDMGLLAPVALAGAVVTALRWPRLGVLTIAWFVLTVIFALGYVNARIDRYYLVPLLIAVLWAALAVTTVLDHGLRALRQGQADPRSHGVGRRRPGSAVAMTIIAAVILVAPVAAVVPGQFDDIDASRETEARRWLDATFLALEEDAVIVSWWSFSTTMWYGRFVERRRPDITIIDDRTILDEGLGNVVSVIERFRPERPVYVIRLDRDLPELEALFDLQRVPGIPSIGVIYRVAGTGAVVR